MGFWDTVDDLLGSAFDLVDEIMGYDKNSMPDFPAEVSWSADEDGIVLSITIPPEGRAQLATIRYYGIQLLRLRQGNWVFVSGVEMYADDDGDFMVVGEVRDDLNVKIFVPMGAALVQSKESLQMRLLALGDDELLGVTSFEISQWPEGPFSHCRLLQPLILLVMRVARADGILDRKEVASIRETLFEVFGLEASDRPFLRDIMKRRSNLSNLELLNELALRLPTLSPELIIQLLATTAHADGTVVSAEVEIIREIAYALGASDEDWAELIEQFQLHTVETRLEDAYKVLGVSPGTSFSEVRRAYLSRIRDYHPDRVNNLPVEFQEVAHRKSQEINTAWEQIKAARSN